MSTQNTNEEQGNDKQFDQGDGGGGGGGGDNKQQQRQQQFQYQLPLLHHQQQQQLPLPQQQLFQQQQQQQQQLFQQFQQQRSSLNPQTAAQYFNARTNTDPASDAFGSGGNGGSASSNGNFELESRVSDFSIGGGLGAGGEGGLTGYPTPGDGGGDPFVGVGGSMISQTAPSFGDSSFVRTMPTPGQGMMGHAGRGGVECIGGPGRGGGFSSILKASNYGQIQHHHSTDANFSGSDGMAGSSLEGGLSAARLVRGNDQLQPTPVVRRGQQQQHQQHHQQQHQQQQQTYHQPQMSSSNLRPSPQDYQAATAMMHQHQQVKKTTFPLPQQQQQQQQQHTRSQTEPRQRMKRKLEPVEEDPSMLRYESRPGLDQSPMALLEKDGGDGNRGSNEGGSCGPIRKRRSMGSNNATGLARQQSSSSEPSGLIQPRDRSGKSSSSMPQRSSSIGSQLRHEPEGGDDGEAQLLQEFPFFFDGYAAWVCRHCQHIPPYYRGGNYAWQNAAPPPNEFVDMHLRICPGLNPENVPPPVVMPPVSELHMQQHLSQQMQKQSQSRHSFPGMQGMHTLQESDGSFPYSMQQTIQQSPLMMPQQQQQMQQMQQQLTQQQQLQQRQSLFSGPQESEMPLSKVENGGSVALDPPGMTSPQAAMPNQRDPGEKDGSGNVQGGSSNSAILSSSGGGNSSLVSHTQVSWDFPCATTGSGHSYHLNQPPQNLQFSPYHHSQFPGQMMAATTALTQYPYHGTLVPAKGSTSVTKPPKRRTSASKVSPKGRPTDDVTYKTVVEFLTKRIAEMALPAATGCSDIGQSLIDLSDADLLTDYFFHMMQQLVVCRFSEKDRKTRGGKRENISIGYGGLQCIHCMKAPSARKFFWSTVDRLANSFAEIPSHILKCKHCPEDVKDGLLVLKGRHPDQMQMLPRGSQKVFFRRMWRRLHDGDARATELATPVRMPLSASDKGRDPLPSEEPRCYLSAASDAPGKSPQTAMTASLLAKSMGKEEPFDVKQGSSGDIDVSKKEHKRVLLAIPEDKDWLSDMDCFVRNNIEVFSAKQLDVDDAAADRKYPIKLGQVGIRCVHCAVTAEGARGAAVSYPYSISGIYESVREFQRLHLDGCQNIPQDRELGSGASSLSSVLRRYYVQAARALGLFDTQDAGICAGANPVPMSTAGFQMPGAIAFKPSTETKEPSGSDAGTVADEIRQKRKLLSSTTATRVKEEDEEGMQEITTKRSKEDALGKANTNLVKEKEALVKDCVNHAKKEDAVDAPEVKGL